MELSHATPARASWQCYTRDERIKLEALVDNYRRRHGPLVAWRLPTGPWAKAFGKHPSSVRRELARGKMRSSAKGKKTTPHNVAAKRGHPLCDRPAEVDGLQVVGHGEGDTLVSCAGDLTALFSLLERISDDQWTRKMGRNTARCLHGALREIVRDGAVIRTVTFDNGSESEQVATLERILRDGGPPATRVFYADAYASNQRARNEKNHTFLRRFLGYGCLAKHSQGTIQHVTDFINDYPRKRFYGKSSREVLELLLQGISPPMRPKPLKKWERKNQPTRAFNLAIYAKVSGRFGGLVVG